MYHETYDKKKTFADIHIGEEIDSNDFREMSTGVDEISYHNTSDELQKIIEGIVPNDWIAEQNTPWDGGGNPWGGNVNWSNFKMTPDGKVFLRFNTQVDERYGRKGVAEKFRCVAEGIKVAKLLPNWLVKDAVTDSSGGEYGQGDPKWGTPEEYRANMIRLFRESGITAEELVGDR